ncbi:hypothetical protein O0544_17480 [Edwardsiella anguillarum]|nr:hypothetical protein [Edwardsiella anguillarum]
MCQSSAEFGFSAFMGKVGVSVADRDRAVQLLTQFGMKQCDKVAAIRKLPYCKGESDRHPAAFAYRDYCRSAAGQELCDCCNGHGMIYRQEDVVKHPGTDPRPQRLSQSELAACAESVVVRASFPPYVMIAVGVASLSTGKRPSVRGSGSVFM